MKSKNEIELKIESIEKEILKNQKAMDKTYIEPCKLSYQITIAQLRSEKKILKWVIRKSKPLNGAEVVMSEQYHKK